MKGKTAGSPFPWEVALGGLCPFLKAAVFVRGQVKGSWKFNIPRSCCRREVPSSGLCCPLVQICLVSSKKISAPPGISGCQKTTLVVGSRRD